MTGETTMRYVILLSGLMMMVGVAHGEIYQWSDKSGVVHFTDNPDNIPQLYRGKAREVDATPTVQESEKPPETQTTTQEKAAPTYGGHDENWWRSSYRSIRDEMKRIQDKLPGKQEDLSVLRRRRALFQRPSDRVAFFALDDEIKGDEQRLTDLQKRLDALDAEATSAGVPLEWRK